MIVILVQAWFKQPQQRSEKGEKQIKIIKGDEN